MPGSREHTSPPLSGNRGRIAIWRSSMMFSQARATGREFEPPCCEVGEVSERVIGSWTTWRPTQQTAPTVSRAGLPCDFLLSLPYEQRTSPTPDRQPHLGHRGRCAPRCLRPRQVLRMSAALDSIGLVDQKAALRRASGEAFCKTSEFNLNDLLARTNRRRLRADFGRRLDGFSPNVRDILCSFEFHDQIPRPSKMDAPGSLIEKLTSPDVNLSPKPVADTDGQGIHPGLGSCRASTVQRNRTWRKRGDPDAWLE